MSDTTPPVRGFFHLKEPRDLLDKLEHDFKRVAAASNDPYPAFDFFVTAEHMLDWLYPGDSNRDRRKEAREANPLLQVLSHIANGAKHMVPEAKHHTSVQQTHAEKGPGFGEGPYGEGPYGGPPLSIDIDPSLWESVGFKSITTLGLADRVLNLWRAWPEFRRSAV